jgi:hypothetical protein
MLSLLLFGMMCLLGRNLIMKILNVLLGLCDLHRELERSGRVGIAHLLLGLSQHLEAFDMLEEIVQKDEALWGQWVLENLVREVAGLHGHLYLWHQHGHWLVEWGKLTTLRTCIVGLNTTLNKLRTIRTDTRK